MINSKKEIRNKEFLTTSEVAKILGVSRVAIFQRIKRGEIQAERIGRNYIVPVSSLFEQRKGGMSDQEKEQINLAVRKVIKDFSEVLRLLGKE